MNPKLLRAGIKDRLSLALTIPASYHDYRIKNYIDLEEPLLEVEIKSKKKTPKLLILEAHAKNINQFVELLFFRTSSYHDIVFKEGAKLFVSATRVSKKSGRLQLLQPQKIASYKIGKIFAQYKVPIRGDLFEAMKQEYLTKDALLQEGLPEDVVERILRIHYPDEQFYKEFKKHKGLFGKYLEALKFLEAYRYIKALKSKRVSYPALCQIEGNFQEYVDSLPFNLTNDQLKALQDIQKDLVSKKAARRMIVGDVGSGKSLVMFGAAFMAKKAILMAPTTILATQLYNEAKKFLPTMKIALITSTSKESDLSSYDFLIGTHALLYKELPKVCLVMIDEQHRFGTQQRNRLKKLVESEAGSPHFLQFSATPIPRTQAMMQSALIDFSFIKETPFKKDITTEVISKEDFKRLLAHITKETEEGRQVLIVYPVVESKEYAYKSLEEAKEFWLRYFDGVYVTHGKDKEKDEMLEEFRERGKILLATTVIEVGISLPKLSTIVIVGAENMGLATLHQLRGRVSREGLKGYCFLYTHDKNNIRLQEFSKTKDGFAIAEMDLRYRKSGDIITGKEQSGKSFVYLNMAEDRHIIERARGLLA